MSTVAITPPSSSRASGGAAGAILLGGFLAGALDITYAMVDAAMRGRSPARPVQAVASGLLGASAFQGGAVTFAFGLFLHFLIASTAAAVYYLASRRIRLLRERVLLPGALFGPLVYLFMNFVVLPLSAVPFNLSYSPRALLIGFAVHVFFVGLPIAFAVRRVYRTQQSR